MLMQIHLKMSFMFYNSFFHTLRFQIVFFMSQTTEKQLNLLCFHQHLVQTWSVPPLGLSAG